MHSACGVKLHVTLKYVKIFGVAQQCFCGKSMSPEK
jgi:hypothetical protein